MGADAFLSLPSNTKFLSMRRSCLYNRGGGSRVMCKFIALSRTLASGKRQDHTYDYCLHLKSESPFLLTIPLHLINVLSIPEVKKPVSVYLTKCS